MSLNVRMEALAHRVLGRESTHVEGLSRARHRAVVTVKSKGEVTLVGPFRAGKNEGPCRSFPFAEEAELDAALGDFLERFLEEAVAP